MASYSLSTATPADRKQVYRIRHAVYAGELGQHGCNTLGTLSDALDEYNDYLVVRHGDEVAGFVSLTPPGRRYSLDKYRSREVYSFLYAEAWELRLLTVPDQHRGKDLATPLLYVAGRAVAQREGRIILAIGRDVLMDYYRDAGFVDTGEIVHSGQVAYHFMFTLPGELCARTEQRAAQSIEANGIQVDPALRE